MQTRLLATSDAAAWDGYLARLPGADIYHTAGYHRAHEANGDGTAQAFVAEDGENVLFHPFMLRDIPGTPYRDIETVYGYNGPLQVGRVCGLFPVSFTSEAWGAFYQWGQSRHLVAEFIRFNPLSGNWARWPDHWWSSASLDCDRETVVLDLMGSTGDIWQRYLPRQRNMVRKALASGLTAGEETTADLSVFTVLYRETMMRNGAADYYVFSDEYFAALARNLGESLRLFCVWDGARTIAAALFLLYGDRMHYHLAGSDPGYSGAGNLLLHTAAMWAWEQAVLYGEREHGYRWLHLGGGRTPDPDDSLLRFKASVSRERRPYYTGRRVHDPDAYRALCDDWRARHPGRNPDYFLLWRCP